MEINLMNMSSLDLEILETNLQTKLDNKLRNLMYDDELDTLFHNLEEINQEKKRRKQVKHE